MSEALLSFEAFDTLWFREGRPFEQMDDGLAEARAVFPPSPSLLAGAVAGLLHPMKQGVGAPDPRLRRMAGADLLAEDQITFAGPFLADGDGQPYCPAPATLLGRKRRRLESEQAFRDGERKAENLGLLLPREDLALGGAVAFRLLSGKASPVDTFEPLMSSGAWMSLSDLALHMADMTAFHVAAHHKQKPVELKVLHEGEIFSREQRIGIAVAPESRTAASGQLFAAQHLRPKDQRAALRLAAFISAPSGEPIAGLADALASVGGKGRFARVSQRPLTLGAHFSNVPEANRREWRFKGGRALFRLTALTPVPVDPNPARDFGLPLPADAGMLGELKIATAIMPRRPVPIGIWNSAARGKPARIVQAHPAGTTWFATAILPRGLKQDAVVGAIAALRFVPQGMEDLGAMGFGVLAAGEWPTYAQARDCVSAWKIDPVVRGIGV